MEIFEPVRVAKKRTPKPKSKPMFKQPTARELAEIYRQQERELEGSDFEEDDLYYGLASEDSLDEPMAAVA